MGDTRPAAAISFLVGFVALAALTGLSGRVPSFDQAALALWWAWTGGLLGARLCLGGGVVGGQLAAALVVDATGAFGVEVREVSWTRIMPVALVGAGLILSRL